MTIICLIMEMSSGNHGSIYTSQATESYLRFPATASPCADCYCVRLKLCVLKLCAEEMCLTLWYHNATSPLLQY